MITLDFWQGRGYNLHDLNTSPGKSNFEKAWYDHGRDQGVTRETGNFYADLPPFPFSGRTNFSRYARFPLPVDSGEGFFFEIEDTHVPGSHL